MQKGRRLTRQPLKNVFCDDSLRSISKEICFAIRTECKRGSNQHRGLPLSNSAYERALRLRQACGSDIAGCDLAGRGFAGGVEGEGERPISIFKTRTRYVLKLVVSLRAALPIVPLGVAGPRSAASPCIGNIICLIVKILLATGVYGVSPVKFRCCTAVRSFDRSGIEIVSQRNGGIILIDRLIGYGGKTFRPGVDVVEIDTQSYEKLIYSTTIYYKL